MPKFVIACPAYRTKAAVHSFVITEDSDELDSISQEEDYQNLLEWDFSISREDRPGY